LDSSVIVRKAVAEARANGGWLVSNVDIVIIGERPKIMAHVDAMKAKVAEIIGISDSQVGIKATTNEGMDSIGQGKALAVQAICLVSRGF
jgi:2-C-methyl-D-erythritol 2,4-cyclodiphosphate synthase